MRFLNRLIPAALSLGLVCLAAWGQAALSLLPSPGEVRLTGNVARVLADRQQFVLRVATVTGPDGRTTALPQPRPKTVTLSPLTSFGFTGAPVGFSGEAVRYPASGLSGLAVGDAVTVIGRSKGDGGELSARLVCLPPPVAEEKPAVPSYPPGQNLLAAPEKAESWTLGVYEPAQAALTEDSGALKVSITAPGKEDWRVQLIQDKAQPERGVSYTLTFRARSDRPRRMRVSAQVAGSDFHDIGINQSAALSPEWADYEYTFVARGLGDKGHLLPVFFFGTEKGAVWLADMSLSVSYPQKAGNLLEPAGNPGAWRLLRWNPGSEGTLRASADSLEVTLSAVGKRPEADAAWHLTPAAMTPLIPGKRYVLTFRGQAGAARTLRIRGIAEPVVLVPEEKDYAVHFRASRVSDFGACPTFVFGDQLGTFRLRGVTLREERENAATP